MWPQRKVVWVALSPMPCFLILGLLVRRQICSGLLLLLFSCPLQVLASVSSSAQTVITKVPQDERFRGTPLLTVLKPGSLRSRVRALFFTSVLSFHNEGSGCGTGSLPLLLISLLNVTWEAPPSWPSYDPETPPETLPHWGLGFHPVRFFGGCKPEGGNLHSTSNLNCTCLEAQIHRYVLPFVFNVSTAHRFP